MLKVVNISNAKRRNKLPATKWRKRVAVDVVGVDGGVVGDVARHLNQSFVRL